MLFQKEIKKERKFDVVVAGGGVAGFTAAIAAARHGKKVALIEDQGALGGILTTGGDPQIGIFYAYYKQAIAGIGWEFCKRLEKKGYAKIPDFSTVDTRLGGHPSNVYVNPAMAEVEMNEMCIEAGVSLFFHTKVIDVLMKGESRKITSLIAAEKGGLAAFSADVFIDCTGDGDIAYFCGAPQEKSSELQPGTFGYTFKCNDLERLDDAKLRSDFEKWKSEGKILHGDIWYSYHAPIINYFAEGGDNSNHIIMDGSTAEGMNKAEIDGRRSMARMAEFLKAESDSVIYASSSYCAPRETRRTVCDYTITADDFLSGAVFPDSVSYTYYCMDLHSSDVGKPFSDENKEISRGIVPTIPYRAMCVKGIYNLLTAGRCISAERAVMGAIRVKASCMGMGEAVGVASALSENGNIRGIDIEELKRTLKNDGAIVPDKDYYSKNKSDT